MLRKIQADQSREVLAPTHNPSNEILRIYSSRLYVLLKVTIWLISVKTPSTCLCFLAPHSPGSPSGLAALRDELLRPRLLRGRSKAAEDLLARHGLLGTIFLIAILHHVDAVNAGKKRLGWRYSLEGLIGRSDGMMMCESWLIRRIIWLWPVGRRGRYDVVRSRRFS